MRALGHPLRRYLGADLATVVLLLRNLSGLQICGLFPPGPEHLMQPGGILALPHINLQADFSIHLADLEPVVVLQGKQGVYEPYIGVYVRDGEGMGRDIQYLGLGGGKVRLRGS